MSVNSGTSSFWHQTTTLNFSCLFMGHCWQMSTVMDPGPNKMLRASQVKVKPLITWMSNLSSCHGPIKVWLPLIFMHAQDWLQLGPGHQSKIRLIVVHVKQVGSLRRESKAHTGQRISTPCKKMLPEQSHNTTQQVLTSKEMTGCGWDKILWIKPSNLLMVVLYAVNKTQFINISVHLHSRSEMASQSAWGC